VVKANLANLHNKLGACSYGLFVLATFFPFMTIEIWGMKQSVPGTEIIDTSVIVLMFLSIHLCLSGAPKWLAKGIAVLSIVYFITCVFPHTPRPTKHSVAWAYQTI